MKLLRGEAQSWINPIPDGELSDATTDTAEFVVPALKSESQFVEKVTDLQKIVKLKKNGR